MAPTARLLAMLTVGVLGLGSLAADEADSPQPPVSSKNLKAFEDRALDPKVDKEKLWDDLIEFRRMYYGTPEAVRAAELLSKIPSPLDRLDRRQIVNLERLTWLPKEAVAVLGDSRGKQWSPVSSLALWS